MSFRGVLNNRIPRDIKNAVMQNENMIGINTNQLKDLMKSEVNLDTKCEELNLKLIELKRLCEYNLVTQERFNKLYQKVRRIVELSIGFFPGPEQAKQAKKEQEKICQEARARIYLAGFSQRDLCKLNPVFMKMTLKLLQAPAPIVEETHACHGAE